MQHPTRPTEPRQELVDLAAGLVPALAARAAAYDEADNRHALAVGVVRHVALEIGQSRARHPRVGRPEQDDGRPLAK